MKNKSIYTLVEHFQKETPYKVDVVLIPKILYYTNDQKLIKENNKKFGIKPERFGKDEGNDTKVVYSRFDGNCVITFSIMFGKKVVYLQLLAKETLTLSILQDFYEIPLNARFFDLKYALRQSIELNKEDITRRPKNVTIEKPMDAGSSETIRELKIKPFEE